MEATKTAIIGSQQQEEYIFYEENVLQTNLSAVQDYLIGLMISKLFHQSN